jgi:Domain of unknown function (DUF4262)
MLNETDGMFLAGIRAQLAAHPVLVRQVGGPGAAAVDVYSYTIGLTAHGHPELMMVGAAHESAYPILIDLGRRVTAHQARFGPGDTVDDVLEGGYPLMIAGPVTPDCAERYPITVATLINHLAGPPLQVVYTDEGYRFPWHPGYNPDRELHQPLLCPVPVPVDPGPHLAAWAREQA